MSINFGSVNQGALAEYFITRYNMVGRDAEYQKNRPTLSYLPRDTEKLRSAIGFKETLKVGKGFSASPDWQIGNQNHTPSKKVQWSVGDPYAEYGRLTFDNLALARNNTATLIDIKASEADDVRDGMLNNTEFQLWNDGTGSRGKVSAISGTTTITVTLTNIGDLYNLEYGMLVYGSTTNTGAGTDHTNRYTITDLDPVNGKFVATRTVDNASVLAVNDFIFSIGSKDAYMPGIPSFIPSSAPADTFFGVTRTGNPALSGWRFPFKASIGETIQRAFTTMGRWVNRAAGKYVVCMSMNDWLLLDLEREGKLVFEDPMAAAKWGLSGLQVRTPLGPVTVIGIPQMPDGRGYIIDWTSWCLYTLKNLPHVIDEDGLTFVRLGVGDPTVAGNLNGDALAMQFRIWKVLLCLQPMSNGTFPTS